MKASGGEGKRPDTREVGETLPRAVWSLFCSSSSPGQSTGPKSNQTNIKKACSYQVG